MLCHTENGWILRNALLRFGVYLNIHLTNQAFALYESYRVLSVPKYSNAQSPISWPTVLKIISHGSCPDSRDLWLIADLQEERIFLVSDQWS
jgi:hypothetical protein